jgi:hypothetical protein
MKQLITHEPGWERRAGLELHHNGDRDQWAPAHAEEWQLQVHRHDYHSFCAGRVMPEPAVDCYRH